MKTQKIQKELKRNILLNPGPATTTAFVKEGLLAPDICPREAEFGEVMSEVLIGTKRVAAPKSVEDQYQSILLGGSGTGAVEAVISSVVSANGKLLVLENGAYGARIAEIAHAFQVPTEVFKTTWGDVLDLGEVEKFLETNTGKYTHLAFIHHETTSGVLNNLDALIGLAKKHNLTTIVDAMSSYAGIEIDLEKTPVDYLISSSNKCIQAMAGIGIVIANKAKLEETKDYPKRNYYFNLYNNYQSQMKKGQFLFTPPVQILYSLKAALTEFFEKGGVKARAKHYADLYEQMHAGMLELGFKALVEKEHHSKILTAFIEPEDSNYHFDKMHDFLYEKGITIYPGKGAKEASFRISNIGDLTSEDISLYLAEMKNYLSSHAISL